MGYYHDFKISEVNSYNITRDLSVISGIPIVEKEMGPAEASLTERERESWNHSNADFVLSISIVKVASLSSVSAHRREAI